MFLRTTTFFQNRYQHVGTKPFEKLYIFYNSGCWHGNLFTFILVYPPFDLPLHHWPTGSWCGPERWGAALFWGEADSLFISSCQTEYCLICSFSVSSISGQMTSAPLEQSHHSQARWKSECSRPSGCLHVSCMVQHTHTHTVQGCKSAVYIYMCCRCYTCAGI